MSIGNDFLPPPNEGTHKYDRSTFHRLYSTYYKALLSYASSLLDSRDEAEDVIQEAFAAVWERGGSDFMSLSHVKRFLYLFVRNKCVDTIRHKKIVDSYAQGVAISRREEQDAEEELFTEEVYIQLFKMIDQLPEKQREVFLLYMKGKSNKEIAAALGVTVETVKTQKRRGKDYLKKNLSPTAKLLLIAFLIE